MRFIQFVELMEARLLLNDGHQLFPSFLSHILLYPPPYESDFCGYITLDTPYEYRPHTRVEREALVVLFLHHALQGK